MLERGPSSLPGIPKRADGRKRARSILRQSRKFGTAGSRSSVARGGCLRKKIELSISGTSRAPCSDECQRDGGTRTCGLCWRKMVTKTSVALMETGEEVKMRRNKVQVMDLILDGGKKSAGTKSASLVTHGRLLCPVEGAMAEGSGAGLGLAPAPG